MQTFEVTLPWPPSLNSMYLNRKSGSGRGRILSPKGRRWKEAASLIIRAAPGYRHELFSRDTDVYVCYLLCEPDKRLRDADNLLKIINDTLQKSLLIVNDAQIRAGAFAFGDRGDNGGVVTVSVSAMSGHPVA